ncbi:DUF6270 domain-containing protein [Phenylobacterium sp.]|uniref:DUF6270 domain-containing protein n=1 Tax=Phenylobacterium sp. TaxID=1871053 RepID=UPI00261AF886|nr:DUF6270 domain-containing protein [Phenylobacterium sp.]
MASRVAIIGSCVTRDVWNLAGFEDDARADLLYVSRTGIASLVAQPVTGLDLPEEPPGDLTRWEYRMVCDDLLKRGLENLADYQPTHLIIDFIDERFDLLRRGKIVATLSWELHRAGLDTASALARLSPLRRTDDRAFDLWRAGLADFARFLGARLPETRLIFHDARWALEHLDEGGGRAPFDPDRVLWPGLPVNIHDQNRLLAIYAQEVRRVLPQAFLVRAPAELAVGDVGHRWGLSPFHYAQPYYRYVWARFQELGCAAPGQDGA